MKEVVGSYFPAKRSGGDDLAEGKTVLKIREKLI